MRLPARLSALAATLGLALASLTAAAPAEAAAHYPGGVLAKGAALEDASTGTMLWSRKLNTERPMASITKVMTALLVLQAGDLSRRIKVHPIRRGCRWCSPSFAAASQGVLPDVMDGRFGRQA